MQEADARTKVAYQKETARLESEQQLRLDEKMARRLQGEDDDEARKAREDRQRRREASVREAALRERAEKARQDEQARQDILAREKAERDRAKAEAKKGGASSFFSSMSGGTSSGKPQPQKRAPFNFQAVRTSFPALTVCVLKLASLVFRSCRRSQKSLKLSPLLPCMPTDS